MFDFDALYKPLLSCLEVICNGTDGDTVTTEHDRIERTVFYVLVRPVYLGTVVFKQGTPMDS